MSTDRMPEEGATQTALFDTVRKAARLSDDGLYRYTLDRKWGDDRVADSCVFVMLNPSTADAFEDDPTIRRCIGFAKRLGCGGLRVINLYAYRSTSPQAMFHAQKSGADIFGPENLEVWRSTMETAADFDLPVIVAWGANAQPEDARLFRSIARREGVPLKALGLTKDGAPRHPLYLKADTPLVPWFNEQITRDAVGGDS